jgi:hypothetical protein
MPHLSNWVKFGAALILGAVVATIADWTFPNHWTAPLLDQPLHVGPVLVLSAVPLLATAHIRAVRRTATAPDTDDDPDTDRRGDRH